VESLTPIHALLEQSADHRGDAVALEHGDVVLTYGEIEAGANRVAARLRDLGVARGNRVGSRTTAVPTWRGSSAS